MPLSNWQYVAVAFCRSENITLDYFGGEGDDGVGWTVSKDMVALVVVSVDLAVSFIAYFMLLGLSKQQSLTQLDVEDESVDAPGFSCVI